MHLLLGNGDQPRTIGMMASPKWSRVVWCDMPKGFQAGTGLTACQTLLCVCAA